MYEAVFECNKSSTRHFFFKLAKIFKTKFQKKNKNICDKFLRFLK